MTMNDIDKSIGNENRYTMWCDSHGQRRFYGVCLWMKNAYDAGRISADDPYSDCAKAIECGSCVALKMRAEEIEANKSIYFSERVIFPESVTKESPKNSLDVNNEESYMRGWNQVGQSLSSTKCDNYKLKEREKFSITHKKPRFEDDDTPIMNVDLSEMISSETAKYDDISNLKKELSNLKREILSSKDALKTRHLLLKAKNLEKVINEKRYG